VIAKESYRKLRKASTFAIRQAAARLSPRGGTTFQTTSPLSFGESFMKIRSAVPENGCLIVLVDGKNKKKTKNNCKTYTHPPPTGRRLRKLNDDDDDDTIPFSAVLFKRSCSFSSFCSSSRKTTTASTVHS